MGIRRVIKNLLPDDIYLKSEFRREMGYDLNLEYPRTFNEKLQWLKLNDHDPRYTMMVDKVAVKKYVADIIGEKYIIPTLGVWDSSDDIDFDKLPNKFVLKCNHNSGLGMCICTDKSQLDFDKVRKDLKKGLKQNYYLTGREWPYKNVVRKVLAEKYLEDETGIGNLTDYKFFCFNGVADCVMLCLDRCTGNTRFYFFDKKWQLRKYNVMGMKVREDFFVKKPKNIDEMFKIAETLSENIKFLRVDLYNVNGRIYFGELTFFPQSGFDSNLLLKTDKYWGSLIKI